jgi:hypothetical protein
MENRAATRVAGKIHYSKLKTRKTEHMRALDTLNPPCYPLSTPLEDNYLVGGRGGGGFPKLTHSHSTQLSDSSRCQIMSSLNKRAMQGNTKVRVFLKSRLFCCHTRMTTGLATGGHNTDVKQTSVFSSEFVSIGSLTVYKK